MGVGGGGWIHPLNPPVSKWQYIVTDVLDWLLDPLGDTLLEVLDTLGGPVLIKKRMDLLPVSLFFKITQTGREEGSG